MHPKQQELRHFNRSFFTVYIVRLLGSTALFIFSLKCTHNTLVKMSYSVADLPNFNGEWKGYYEQFGNAHAMVLSFTFNAAGTISGEGDATVGQYTITGKVEPDSSFQFTKQYAGAHSVEYKGTVQWGDGELPVLSGKWSNGQETDSFLLRPNKNMQQFSSEWKGCYSQFGSKHEMKLTFLMFQQDAKIFGAGTDDIGKYEISGCVDPKNCFCFTKQYIDAHSVSYSGSVHWKKMPTLQGNWVLGDQTDSFELKPVQCMQEYSGEWKGYYMQNGNQNDMDTCFAFYQDGQIAGKGKDSIDSYTILGKMKENDAFEFTKQYASTGTDAVTFTGSVKWVDEQPVMEGQWKLGSMSDKFSFNPVMA